MMYFLARKCHLAFKERIAFGGAVSSKASPFDREQGTDRKGNMLNERLLTCTTSFWSLQGSAQSVVLPSSQLDKTMLSIHADTPMYRVQSQLDQKNLLVIG
eukprot:2880601-Amphidinium_carterae.1